MGLYISTASASQDNKESRINQAITKLAETIALQRMGGGFPGSPSLDVNFLLPGKYDQANFSGMQMGGYTDQEHTLYFECAVPERMIHSNQAERYVQAVMEDVVSNAAEFFNDIAISFDQSAWMRAIDQLRRQL